MSEIENPCVKCKQEMSEEWLEKNCNPECVRLELYRKAQKRGVK